MPPAIRVDDLRKCYRLGAPGRRAGYRTLREGLAALPGLAIRARRGRSVAARESEFWALRGVDLEVNPGEVVGIIGRNGAGKSTLLKVLSRITRPTAGRVELRGRVGSLLEVGTGFHPELTGRENIFLNGAILGMRRAEVARSYDEIVAFAGVERFLDTAVKHYSSGMYVRLAFAVAAHLETEILLVDEVLAVGDAEFQRRCTDKMRSVSRSGRTVLFVSHNMPSVEHLCDRCILLVGGRIEADGETSRVLAVYNQGVGDAPGPVADLGDHPGRTIDSTPSMIRVEVGTVRDGARSILMGDDIAIRVGFETKELLRAGVTFGVAVKNSRNSSLFGINNLVIPSPALDRPVRRGEVTCRLIGPPLMPGSYSLDLFLGTRGQNFDVVLDACRFEVLPTDHFGSGQLPPRQAGDVYCPATWGLENDD